jgi:hypothetical protein
MKGVLLACSLLAPPAGLPSNVAPLAFGMTPQQVTTALGAPLTYVSGRPQAEVYYTVTPAGVPGFYPVDQSIYLQFRKGCLTGWKKDWHMRRGFL